MRLSAAVLALVAVTGVAAGVVPGGSFRNNSPTVVHHTPIDSHRVTGHLTLGHRPADPVGRDRLTRLSRKPSAPQPDRGRTCSR